MGEGESLLPSALINGSTTAVILVAKSLITTCATTVKYPHEVLRMRMQTQTQKLHPESGTHLYSQASPGDGTPMGVPYGSVYQPRCSGLVHTCWIILAEEGRKAFHTEMGTDLIRAVPAAMTTMVTFGSVKAAIGRLQEEGKGLEEGKRLEGERTAV
ncbi:hypothetical protein LTR56_027375 [Elasticomyces elasticus]|nr:hypothetical protein LTR56_027375 [Elasticomyces elasticus]